MLTPIRIPSHTFPKMLITALCLAACIPASAKVVYVNKDAPGPAHDGASWATAFVAVQPAVSAAAEGDEVWVARGVYVGSITSSLSLYGGFAGTETERSQRNWAANVTVLDGQNSDATLSLGYRNGGASVADGFTIRNGHTGAFADYCASANLENCTISGNSNGVSMYGCSGSVMLTNCSVSGGSCGVSLSAGTRAALTNCTISGSPCGIRMSYEYQWGGCMADVAGCNITGNSESGISAWGSAAYVTNSILSGNGAGVDVGGGTIEGIAFNGYASLTNCTISANSYGVRQSAYGAATLDNSIVAFNGTGIDAYDASSPPTLSHNDVYGNTAANYAKVTDPTGSNGNISLDPLFTNRAVGNYRLNVDSPCIDAGSDPASPGGVDRDGRPRVLGAHVDMGAYEYSSPLPSHLVFTTQPDLGEAGKPLQQQPVLIARDANNVLVPDFDWPVKLAIKAGTGTPGAALTGSATVTAANGVASFSNVGVSRKGSGYVLEAFVGTSKLGESAAFNVAPKAERLVFAAQPGGAAEGRPFTAQPIVRVVDGDGETAALDRSMITLAIKPGGGAAGAALSGATSAMALHGIAGFGGLAIDKVGAGYMLTATSPGLTPADSAGFDVVETPKLALRQSAPDELEVSAHPAGAKLIGATVALSWSSSELAAVQEADIRPAAGWSLDSADTTSGVTATLSNAGTEVNGPVLLLHLLAQPEFTGLTATVSLRETSDLTGDDYTQLPVAPQSLAFVPSRSHLAFTRQPAMAAAGAIIAGQPAVAMLDGAGGVVADFTGAVTVSIKPDTGAPGAVLGGTPAVSAAAGVAAFNDLTIDRKGSGYVLVASSGPFSAESLPFNIAPKALGLAFATQPGSGRAGLPLAPQPVITVQDGDGATALAFTGPVTLGIQTGTGFPGATLGGTATLNAVAGVATFSDLRVGEAAPGYVLIASGQSLAGARSASFDVTPFAFTTADVTDSLRWASGLAPMPLGYLARFDSVANGQIDAADATRQLRKVVGLEPNP
ncbi:MAG TPA: right-handed parallel beta-helix repeat-containing protein [Armatimonadota bacterium]|jgi:hypothetical protein